MSMTPPPFLPELARERQRELLGERHRARPPAWRPGAAVWGEFGRVLGRVAGLVARLRTARVARRPRRGAAEPAEPVASVPSARVVRRPMGCST